MTNAKLIEKIRALASGQKPAEDLSELLYRHRCFYWLSKAVHAQQAQDFVLEEKALNRIAVKERYKTCQPLFESLSIPYAVIKGAVLSNVTYGDPFLRSSGDIDLLIRRKDADTVKDILHSLGFVQGRITDKGVLPFTRRELIFQATASHQTAPYIKQTENPLCPYVNVDVNTDLLWGEHEEKADMDSVLSYTEQTSLFDISLQKLTAEIEWISLCLHHYKDMNSLYLLTTGSLRLGLFCDLYYYLRNVRPSPKVIQSLCHELNVGRYVYVCLRHTQEIFDDPLLIPYLDALDCEKDLSLLNTFGLTEQERKAWNLTLLERLFHPDLPHYVESRLSRAEHEKIKINRAYM